MKTIERILICVLVVVVAVAASVALVYYISSDFRDKVDYLHDGDAADDMTVAEISGKIDSLLTSVNGLNEAVSQMGDEMSKMQGRISELEQNLPDKLYVPIGVPVEEGKDEPEFEYQALYKDMYIEDDIKIVEPEHKIAYLTFDDGPSDRTDEILAILEKYNIKATFFVVPRDNEQSKKRMNTIIDSGNALGVHCYNHVYSKIYASQEAFMEDFSKAFDLIWKSTCVKPEIFRFPGGSINAYTASFYQPLAAEMIRRGFVYFDWNASGDDAAGQNTAKGIADTAVSTALRHNKAVILLHDAPAKTETVKALPNIIERLLKEGYSFDVLSRQVKAVTYAYKN